MIATTPDAENRTALCVGRFTLADGSIVRIFYGSDGLHAVVPKSACVHTLVGEDWPIVGIGSFAEPG